MKLRSQEAMKGPDATGFTFDRVFQMDTKQEEVFEYGVRGIVDGQSYSRASVRSRARALNQPGDPVLPLRCHGRLQRNSLRLRSNGFGKISHHDGAIYFLTLAFVILC